MNKAVIIDKHEISTSLGNLNDTVDTLCGGHTAVYRGHCFGFAIPSAPFADKAHHDMNTCIRRLAAQINFDSLKNRKNLLIYCAAKGDIRALDSFYTKRDEPGLPSPLPGMQALLIKESLDVVFTRMIVISNACASGSTAIELATELLMTGQFENAVIAGYDSLSGFVASGFLALGALSLHEARPFDRNRDGLMLGEGAAIAVLSLRIPESGDICIAGAASSNDANHRTGPSRTGEGLYLAAANAVKASGLNPDQIGAVKCHGTATVYNDAMEAKAIYRLFGDTIPPCASLKGAIGHTSGASSLVEVLCAAQFLKRRALPPTAGYHEHGVDEPIPVSSSRQEICRPAVLCLSAGFGGVNSAVVITECTA